MLERVPELNRKELAALARIGVLNALENVSDRRDALWQVEEAGRRAGPLLRGAHAVEKETHAQKPLRRMNDEERLAADYAGTGLTTGPHPMAYHRAALREQGILCAVDLAQNGNRPYVRIAGCVIARQRPGTAKGFVFLSLEDETGIANIILTPDFFESHRAAATRSRFLRVEGPLQNQGGVIHVKAQHILPLEVTSADVRSRDFY